MWCVAGEFYLVENKQAPATPPGEGGTGPRADANNLAYTGLPLAFHTDLPHYASPPQVQLLRAPPRSSNPAGARGRLQRLRGPLMLA